MTLLNSGINNEFKLTDTPKIMSTIDGLIVKSLEKIGGNILDISRIKNINKVYNAIYNEKLDELEKYEDTLSKAQPGSQEEAYYSQLVRNLDKLLDDKNWNDVIKYHFGNSKLLRDIQGEYRLNDDNELELLDDTEQQDSEEAESQGKDQFDRSTSELS